MECALFTLDIPQGPTAPPTGDELSSGAKPVTNSSPDTSRRQFFFLGWLIATPNCYICYLSIYLSIYLYTWGWCFCSESHLKIARCGRYIITGSKYQPKQKDTGFSRYDSPNMRWFDTLSCHLWSPNMGGVIHPNLNVTNKKKDDLYRSYVLCKWWHTHFPC